jgi:hypothetical protein
LAFAQHYGEPDLQLRGSAASAAAAAAASAASAATSGDADVPGRVGDPGDGRMSGSAAAASAAAAGARARLSSVRKTTGPSFALGPVFFGLSSARNATRCAGAEPAEELTF